MCTFRGLDKFADCKSASCVTSAWYVSPETLRKLVEGDEDEDE